MKINNITVSANEFHNVLSMLESCLINNGEYFSVFVVSGNGWRDVRAAFEIEDGTCELLDAEHNIEVFDEFNSRW